MCAKYRKGHFEGVLDVMDRLTKKISPKYIFMGIKDYQQLYLVKNYIEKKYECKVVPCKTIRNSNKLALSSRNLLLNKKAMIQAESLTKDLIKFKKDLVNVKNIKNSLNSKKKELSKLYNIFIEYLELRNKKTLKRIYNNKCSKLFISYYLNNVRLIDNF